MAFVQRDFAEAARNIEHIIRQCETREAFAQFRHQRLAALDRQAEMRRAGRKIGMVAPEVLPKRSMLEGIFSGEMPSLVQTASLMR